MSLPVSGLIPPDAPSRFDLLLALVPLAFLIGAVVVAVTSISPHVAGAASAAVAGVALIDGTAIRPPR
jgi:hypothetical protein